MKHFKEGHARRSIRLRTKILLVCMSLVILCATLWAVLEKGVEAQIEEKRNGGLRNAAVKPDVCR